MNVFDCAIKIEEEAREFYQKMEEDSSSAELKTLFSMLAAAEQEHLETLKRMKRSVSGGQGMLEGLSLDACAFRPLQAKRDLMTELKNDPDFYLHAMREEEQDLRFYEEMAQRSQDEGARQRLFMIAEEQRKHLNKIENIYTFVEAPKSYLAWGEFSNRYDL